VIKGAEGPPLSDRESGIPPDPARKKKCNHEHEEHEEEGAQVSTRKSTDSEKGSPGILISEPNGLDLSKRREDEGKRSDFRPTAYSLQSTVYSLRGQP
jgi:hypothetical protein